MEVRKKGEEKMKWIINLIAKFSGASALWEKINGYKTYIGAVAAILTGVAGLLTGITALTDFASVLAFVQALSTNPSWLTILAGWTVMAKKHSEDKKEAKKD